MNLSNFLAQFGRMIVPGGREELPTTILCQDIFDCIKYFGGLIANIIFVLVLIGAVIIFLIGAIFYLISGSRGNEEDMKKARNMLIYSVVAAVLASLAWVIINAIVSSIVFIPSAFAQDIFALTTVTPSCGNTAGEVFSNCIASPTVKILNYGYWLGLILALVMVVYSGYTYITSRGKSENIKKATSTLIWALVGLIVAVLSWFIIKLITSLFNP